MGLSGTIWDYLELSGTIWDYLGLSGTIWDYLWISLTISDYLGLSRTISDYLGLSGTIWNYLGLSGTIWAYLGQSGTIWDYLGLSHVSGCKEKQERTIYCYLKLFPFFPFFFCISPTRVIEKLALLKTQDKRNTLHYLQICSLDGFGVGVGLRYHKMGLLTLLLSSRQFPNTSYF